MHAIWRKSLSLLMVVMMIVSMLPVNALAADLGAAQPADIVVEEAADPVIPEATEPVAEEPVQEETPAEEAPAEEPAEEPAAEETPAEEPAEETPAEEPAEEAPVEEAPAEEPVVEERIDEPANDGAEDAVAVVQAMIDALPGAEAFDTSLFETEEDYVEALDVLEEQLDAIDEAAKGFAEEQHGQLDDTKYSLAWDIINGYYLSKMPMAITWVEENGTYYVDMLNGTFNQGTLFGYFTNKWDSAYNGTLYSGYYYNSNDSIIGATQIKSNSGDTSFTHNTPYYVWRADDAEIYVGGSKATKVGSFTARAYYEPTVTITGVTGYTGTVTPSASGVTKIYAGTNNAVVTVPMVEGYKVTGATYGETNITMTEQADGSWKGTFTATDSTAVTVTYDEDTVATYKVTVSEVNGDYGDAYLNSDKTEVEGVVASGTVDLDVTYAETGDNIYNSFEVAVTNGSYDASTGKVTVAGTGDVTVTVTFSKIELTAGTTSVAYNGFYASAADSNYPLTTLKAAILSGMTYNGEALDTSKATIQYYPYYVSSFAGSETGRGYSDEDNKYDLNATRSNFEALGTGWTFYAFGARGYSEGAAFTGCTEKVIITYEGLTIVKEITLTEARTGYTLVKPEMSVTFETQTDIDNAVKNALAEANSGESITVSFAANQTLPTGGQTEGLTYNVTVEASAKHLGCTDTVTIAATAKSNPANISFETAGTGSGTVKFGGLTANGTLAAGTYTLTVTPDDWDGSDGSAMYVDKVEVNGTALTGSYADGVYTASYIVANDSDYTIKVTYGQRVLTVQDVSFEVNGYNEASKRADYVANVTVDNVVVSAMQGGVDVKDSANLTVELKYSVGLGYLYKPASELNNIYLDVNSSRPLKITWAGDEKYPEVVSTDAVNAITTGDSRPAVDIALGEMAESYNTEDAFKEALEAVSVTYNGTAVPTEAYTVTVNAPAEGETGYTVTVSAIEGTADYQAHAAWTSDPVAFNVTKYTITWVNGDATTKSENVPYGTTAEELKNMAPAASKSDKYDDNGVLVETYTGSWPALAAVTGDATYTATFTATKEKYTYTIETYTMDAEGNYGTPVAETETVDYGTEVSVTPETIEGFTVDTDASVTSATVKGTGVTLKVYYIRNQYTVTYYDTDGTTKLHEDTYYFDADVTEFEPTKENHQFGGWADDATVPPKMPAENLDFAVKEWTVDKYQVTWEVDGVKSYKNYGVGETIVLPEDPDKFGYDFKDWDGYTAGMTMPAEDVTFTATWTPCVAAVNGEDYTTIDEAVAAWTAGKTLTLLADVTLSDVITLSSQEHHYLDLGTYTMTAASGENAIEIKSYGRSNRSESGALTITADATNPGGIDAGSKACVYYKYDSTLANDQYDRPIIYIKGGVFTSTSNGISCSGHSSAQDKCATFNISGGTFNCNLNLQKAKLLISGGTFNGSVGCTGGSTSLRQISGGTFKSFGFMTADAASKFWVGTSKACYDVGVYVDDNGYLVVDGPVITEPGTTFEASSTNYGGWHSALKYSSAAANELYYTSLAEAMADNNKASGKVTVYVDEYDMTGYTYKGTLLLPESYDGDDTLTLTFPEGTTPAWSVGAEKADCVAVCVAESTENGVVTRVYKVGATVTFVDEDGTTVLKESTYVYGTAAGDIVTPTNPTKTADDGRTYEFAGWTPKFDDVTAKVTYTATYIVTGGTIAINKYLAGQSDSSALYDTANGVNLRSAILTAVDLDPTGNYVVTVDAEIFGQTVEVEIAADGVYHREALIGDGNYTGMFALLMSGRASMGVTITDAENNSKEVLITIEDTRKAPVIEQTVTALPNVESLPTSGANWFTVTTEDGTTVPAANVTVDISKVGLPANGETLSYPVYVSVDDNEYSEAQDAKEYSIAITNPSYQATIGITQPTGAVIAVTKKGGSSAVNDGDAVDGGTYVVTVTPTANTNYYVEGITVTGTEAGTVAAEGSWAAGVYTAEITVPYGETAINEVAISADVKQRDFTVTNKTIEVYSGVEDKAKEVFYAAVDNADTYKYDEFGVTTDAAELVTGNTYTYTITWKATDKYPAVAKDVQVKIIEDRKELNFGVGATAIEADEAADYTAEAIQAAVAVSGLPEGATCTLTPDMSTIPAEFKQGDEVTVTVTVTVAESKNWLETTKTVDVTVQGKVFDAMVDITTVGEGTAAYSTETQKLTMTAADAVVEDGVVIEPAYFVDTISISTDGAEAVVTDLDKIEECTETLANGSGKELGYQPKYAVTVTFSQPSITIPANDPDCIMTYYPGLTTDVAERNQRVLEALEKATDGTDIIYNPLTMNAADTKIEYLARAAGTVPTTVSAKILGQTVTRTVNVPVGDMWKPIDADIVLAPMPSQARINEVAEELVLKYAADIASGKRELEDVFLEVLTDPNYADLAAYYDTFGAHVYGDNTDNTETVRLLNGDVISNRAVIILKDDRQTTSISLKADQHLTYGFTEAELLAAIVESVNASADGVIGGAADVVLVTPIDTLNASEEALTVEVKYPGVVNKYQDSTATTTIYVDRAPVNVSVDNRLIQWKQGLTYDLPVSTIPEGVATINFIVGLDVSDVNFEGTQIQGIMGDVQLLLPEEMQSLLGLVDSYLGTSLANGGSITVSQLQGALTNIGGLFEGSEYEEMINVLLNMLNSLPTDVADLELTVGGAMPTDIGVYLVGAVSADSNYTTDFGLGFVVITPNGIKAEIDWKQDDDNYLITRTLLTTKDANGNYLFDASGVATSVAENGDLDFATEQIVELFVGMDVDGNFTLETDQTKLNVGAYVEVAMIVNWGNEVYYSEPIARPFVVVAETLDVKFVDENGDENADRIFEFDNTAKDDMENVYVTYKQDGNGYVAGDEVNGYGVKYLYVGVRSNGEPYASSTAPVHAGAYTVTALVTLRDSANGITHAGVAVGALAITPTESELEITNKAVPYGEEYGVADMITAKSTVPGLTPDTTIITAALSADLDTINGLEDIKGTVNVDMPLWLDNVIQTLGILEAGYTETGIQPATFLAYVDQIKAAVEGDEVQTVLNKLSIEVDLAGLDQLADIIGQLPENTKLTFFDDPTYSEVGVYLVMGVVTDSDHWPSVGAGVMVICPDATKVELRFEEDWNDNYIFTQAALLNMNLDAAAYNPGTNTVNATADAMVTNLYVGFNDNGEVVLTAEEGAEASLDNGAYTQVAFLLDISNTPYYAEPIARAFLIVPTPATIEFIDENGVSNPDRHFVFDNTAHEMPVRVTVLGEVIDPGENLSVKYVGLQTNGETWNSSEAPVHAGSYVVTATYTERDSIDRLVTLGVAVGAMVIEPAKTSTDVVHKDHEYDGEYVGVNDMVHVTTDSGVNPDTIIITAAIKTDGSFSENLLGAIEHDVNIDLPAWTDEILSKLQIPTADATPADFISAIETAEDKIIALAAEVGVEVEEGFLDQLKAIVEQLPSDASLSFNDNAQYKDVGAYLVIGIVTDSDHWPSMDANVLVIYPDVTEAKLHWIYDDTNGIFTLDTLSVIDLGAYATIDDVKSDAVPFKVLYLGVNAETLEITITRDQADLDVGAYTEIAYVLDVGSEMYAAAPITRPVIIVPNAYEVKAEDATYTYDGTAKGIEVTEVLNQFGENIIDNGTLTVTYTGVTTAVKGYLSSEAPTDAGLYNVVITFVTYDDAGNVTGAGAKVVDLAIEVADPVFDLTDATFDYDGTEKFVGIDNDHLDVDYIGLIRTEDGINLFSSEGLKDVVSALDNKTYYDLTELKEAIQSAIDAVAALDIDSAFVDELLATIEEANNSAIYKLTANGTNPINAGTYAAYAITVPTTNYRMDVSKGTLNILPIEITEADVALDGSLTYNATEQTQGIKVTDGVTYDVTGNTGTEAGTYTLTVTGKGNYTGEVELDWIIKQAEITSVEVTSEHTYNGTEQTATIVVKAGDLVLAESDYTVTGNTGTNADDYTVTVTGKGNFTGTPTADWKIAPKAITAADVKLDGSLTYDGSVQTQNILVTDGITYDVTGNTGTNAGTYILTVTGKDNYTGSVSKEWIIAKRAAAVAAESFTINYGEPVPTLAYEVKNVVENDSLKGISVTCGPVTNVGIYDIIVTVDADLNPNYSVTAINGTLTVNEKTIIDKNITIGALNYNGQAQTPEVVVTVADKKLVSGTDYTVTVEAQKNAGEYVLTVEGIGNYTGKIENLGWSIEPKAVSITINNQEIDAGDALPANSYTVTAGEVIPGDDLNLTYSYADSNDAPVETPKAVGQYVIKAVDDDGNYDITIEKTGILTIKINYICWNMQTGVHYEDVTDAFDEAASGQTIQMLKDATAAINGKDEIVIIVGAGETFDLNGHYVETDNLLSFGNVIDTAKTTGGIKISSNTAEAWTQLQPANGGYLPIYDTNTGSYKFFKGEGGVIQSWDMKGTTTSSAKFRFFLMFDNLEAYKVIAESSNTGLDVVNNMAWSGISGFGITYTMSDGIVKIHSQNQYDTNRDRVMSLIAHGIDRLESGDFISCQPTIVSQTGVSFTADTLTHVIP